LSNFFADLLLHGHHSGLHVVDEDVHRQYSLYDPRELQAHARSQTREYAHEDVFYYIHWDSDHLHLIHARHYGLHGDDASAHRGENHNDLRA
jgi:hypothetical protein